MLGMCPIEAVLDEKHVWTSSSGTSRAVVGVLELTYFGDDYGGFGIKENGESLLAGQLVVKGESDGATTSMGKRLVVKRI